MANDPNMILNPATGRYVLRTGATGKSILAAQRQQQQPVSTLLPMFERLNVQQQALPTQQPIITQQQVSTQQQPQLTQQAQLTQQPQLTQQQPAMIPVAPISPAQDPNLILNPATGRYVSRTGVVGKQLLRNIPIAQQTQIPSQSFQQQPFQQQQQQPFQQQQQQQSTSPFTQVQTRIVQPSLSLNVMQGQGQGQQQQTQLPSMIQPQIAQQQAIDLGVDFQLLQRAQQASAQPSAQPSAAGAPDLLIYRQGMRLRDVDHDVLIPIDNYQAFILYLKNTQEEDFIVPSREDFEDSYTKVADERNTDFPKYDDIFNRLDIEGVFESDTE